MQSSTLGVKVQPFEHWIGTARGVLGSSVMLSERIFDGRVGVGGGHGVATLKSMPGERPGPLIWGAPMGKSDANELGGGGFGGGHGVATTKPMPGERPGLLIWGSPVGKLGATELDLSLPPDHGGAEGCGA